jgi:hypothetical protein
MTTLSALPEAPAQKWKARSPRLSQEATMVEERITAPDNVVELAAYQRGRIPGAAFALSPRSCGYCGAELGEGEREDECSSALNVDTARLRWRAAQILRGLV